MSIRVGLVCRESAFTTGLWAIAKNVFLIWVPHHELYIGTNNAGGR